MESVLTSKKHVIVLIAILSLLITAAGYLSFKYQASSIRQEKYNELKAIADLKESQIEQWLKQRNTEVTVISQGPFLTNSIPRLLQGSVNEQLKQSVLQLFRLYQKEFGYENIFLATINGKLLLSAKTGLEEVDTFTKQKITEASIKKEIAFSDLYFSQTENKIHYDIIVPIISSENKTIAILLFRRDPNDFLFPLIETWPTPSKSAETVILRVENDRVVYLNELRQRKNTALKLRISLTRTEVPAVQAALGRTGLFEGIDYRGGEVLSDIRIIPSTNWIMLSKVDKSEIYSGLYLTAGVIAGFSIFLIIICGVSLAFIYNSRQKNIFLELYNKEKELWQYQEKFKVTMDSLGDGIITTDSNGKIQYINKIAEELTSWNFREARGRMLSEVYSVKNEETGQKESNILEKVVKQGIVKELANHTILISKSGKEIPVMDTGSPIYDNDGSIIGIVIVFQDETEKRKQQNLIRESEFRFRSTLDNMLEACQILGKDWSYLYLNASAEQHNRRPNKELLGKKYMEMWPGIEATEVFALIKRCMEEQVSNQTENEFIFPDGTKGNFRLSIESIPEGVLILSEDITERRRAENDAKQSRERFKRLVSELNDVVWTATFDGSELIDINDSFEKIYGISCEIFRANPKLWMDMVHPADRPIAEMSAKELLDKGRTQAEYRIVRPDGTTIWLFDRKSLIYDNNRNPIGMGGIAKDITIRKLAEQAIINARDKAEEMNRLKSNFLANMSHELRTPLNGILGYAEILNSLLKDPEQIQMSEGIYQSGNRLSETLKSILELSLAETDRFEVDSKTIEVIPVLQKSIKSFSFEADKKNILLETIVKGENIYSNLDENLFMRIICNLVDNALKFTKEGKISVEIGPEVIDAKEWFYVKIKDTGIGIPSDKIDLIWEEFRQVSEGLTRSFEGPGLGLTISKKAVNLMHGQISVESELGTGSTFTVKFPMVQALQKEELLQKKQIDTLPETKRDFIDTPLSLGLYVEDDSANRHIVKLFLKNTSIVETANDGETALQLAAEKKYDFILMDINLGGGMNGMDVVSELLKMPQYKNTPIVAVTAYAMEKDKAEFLKGGCTHYSSKPFKKSDIVDLVTTVIADRN